MLRVSICHQYSNLQKKKNVPAKTSVVESVLVNKQLESGRQQSQRHLKDSEN